MGLPGSICQHHTQSATADIKARVFGGAALVTASYGAHDVGDKISKKETWIGDAEDLNAWILVMYTSR